MLVAILVALGLIAVMQACFLMLMALEATLRQRMIERAVLKALPDALRTITREWVNWTVQNGQALDYLIDVKRGIDNNNLGLTKVVAFLEQTAGFEL